MKQLKKYCIGMLLLVTLVFATACGRSNNGTTNNNAGTGTTGETGTTTDGHMNENVTDTTNGNNAYNIDDYLFDTNGDGIYDHTDVDRDGLLEEIGRDANDVVDDLVNDVTGEHGEVRDETVVDNTDGTVEHNGTVDNNGTVEKENGKKTP